MRDERKRTVQFSTSTVNAHDFVLEQPADMTDEQFEQNLFAVNRKISDGEIKDRNETIRAFEELGMKKEKDVKPFHCREDIEINFV